MPSQFQSCLVLLLLLAVGAPPLQAGPLPVTADAPLPLGPLPPSPLPPGPLPPSHLPPGPLPGPADGRHHNFTLTITAVVTKQEQKEQVVPQKQEQEKQAVLLQPVRHGGVLSYPESGQVVAIPQEDAFRADVDKKKIHILLICFCFSIVGAVVLSFVNTSHDLQEMQDFYKGYMGRRLMLRENTLLFKDKDPSEEGVAVNFIHLGSWEQETGLAISPAPPSPHPSPLTRRKYVEDEDPEWRALDYTVDICPPPDTFCTFLRQSSWGVFYCDRLTPDQVERRQNLISQFRRWKKRKRKNFTIVVTERARREMADQEEQKNKKRQGGGKPS